MKRLFVDTGAWLAVAVRNDGNHSRAAEFYRRAGASARWITSDFVLDELTTRLRALQSAEAAVKFVRAIRSSPACQVLPITEDLFEESLSLMLKFADHRLSLTDCTSFALMDYLGLREVFAFDSDFAHCGYSVLP